MRGQIPAASVGGGSTPKDWFSALARYASVHTGKPTTFLVASLTVVAWALTGPYFDYSDTWQLVINTGTTIITFLMVFLIQNTQIRDTIALQLKLDELIRATRGARNSLIAIEDTSEGFCHVAERGTQERPRVTSFQATAARQASIAVARKPRWVDAEVRCRWTLKVL